MSGYEIQTLRPDTSIMMDGLSQSPQLIDVLYIPAGQNSSKGYGRVPNAANLSFVVVSGAVGNMAVAQASGYAYIGWNSSTIDATVFVFATATTIDDPYGIQYVNSAGLTLADQGLPSPQWMQTITLNSGNLHYTYQTADGYICSFYSVTIHYATGGGRSDSANAVVLMGLPDVGGDDTWYYCNTSFALGTGTGYTLELRVYSRGNYKLPSLYLYAVDTPVDSGNPYGLKLTDRSARLMFDSSAETLSGRDNLTIGYAGYPNVNSYGIATQGNPAIGLPQYFTAEGGGGGAVRYVGVANRVGSTIRTRHILDTNMTAPGGWALQTPPVYSKWSAWTPVADVSHVSFNEQYLAPQGFNYAYPGFSTLPQNVTVRAGQTATFVANAAYANYEWSSNVGGLASGNTFNVYNCQLNQNGGQISVFASNALGRVWSGVVTLYVNPAEFSTYHNVSGSAADSPPYYSIYPNGATDNGGNWADGNGDGSLYRFTATLGGSANGPTSGDFSGANTWSCGITNIKTSTGSGSVAVSIYLKSNNALVSTVNIHLSYLNPNQ